MARLAMTVQYRGKQGLRTMRAAIITATQDTLDPRNVEAGHVPALDSADHVHLWVFTPAVSGPNAATGGFPEFNVPLGEAPSGTDIPPGSWTVAP